MSSAPYIGSEIREVGEECQHNYSQWEASIKNVGPFLDVDNFVEKSFVERRIIHCILFVFVYLHT